MERVRWSPKVRRSDLWQVYQNDALGSVDEALLRKVGYALLARCQAILMVTRHQVECPRCGSVFDLGDDPHAPARRCPTPECAWEVSPSDWRASWRHQDLLGTRIEQTCQAFVEAFPKAKDAAERMFRIDRLIHAFHWDAQTNLPNRSAANNLIEGSHEDVIAMLDRLSAVGDPQAKESWRAAVDSMWKRRRGQS